MSEEEMLNILLVNDDEAELANVQRAFKKHPIANPLFIANNNLETLRRKTPKVSNQRRLILLALRMPKTGGIESLKALRANHPLKATKRLR